MDERILETPELRNAELKKKSEKRVIADHLHTIVKKPTWTCPCIGKELIQLEGNFLFTFTAIMAVVFSLYFLMSSISVLAINSKRNVLSSVSHSLMNHTI